MCNIQCIQQVVWNGTIAESSVNCMASPTMATSAESECHCLFIGHPPRLWSANCCPCLKCLL